jgi:hypothetical protein
MEQFFSAEEVISRLKLSAKHKRKDAIDLVNSEKFRLFSSKYEPKINDIPF